MWWFQHCLQRNRGVFSKYNISDRTRNAVHRWRLDQSHSTVYCQLQQIVIAEDLSSKRLSICWHLQVLRILCLLALSLPPTHSSLRPSQIFLHAVGCFRLLSYNRTIMLSSPVFICLFLQVVLNKGVIICRATMAPDIHAQDVQCMMYWSICSD